MKKIKNNLFIIILVLLMLISFTTLFIYAWLTDIKEKDFSGETSSLDIEQIIWFELDGVDGYTSGDVLASNYLASANEENLDLLMISTGDVNASNYIGNLRMRVDIKTNGKYYIRLRFKNEWYMKRTSYLTETTKYMSLNQENDEVMPYGLADSLYYETNSNYVYYENLLEEDSLITIIDKASTTAYEDKETATSNTTYFLYLDIEIEYVQANRMQAIWGLDSIPTNEEDL